MCGSWMISEELALKIEILYKLFQMQDNTFEFVKRYCSNIPFFRQVHCCHEWQGSFTPYDPVHPLSLLYVCHRLHWEGGPGPKYFLLLDYWNWCWLICVFLNYDVHFLCLDIFDNLRNLFWDDIWCFAPHGINHKYKIPARLNIFKIQMSNPKSKI